MTDLANLRRDYLRATLDEASVAATPVEQFRKWCEEAIAAGIADPNAACLSTAGADGRPLSRILLVKAYDEQGFVFFTNYNGPAGVQLAENPQACLLFWWKELERQVRIEGTVHKIDPEESDKYFTQRPLKSRLASLASDQSQPIASREAMKEKLDKVTQEAGDNPVRPPHWGGYRVVPSRVEFWQGREARFHDRILFTGDPSVSGWATQRLQP
eukprot:Protomagalhaensia_sp_Gyna_25__2893@NODE_2690_length_943_cov_216_994469_g2245_i0_p1_GENE_NODE_2690_length_943_cov_216_994469_g2245_i0NODE_2690_length_943_cov_216_994469_g2245_i0_p1_ORF_typecomplete_len214_score45_77Putative_PNPOx/PF01243_20/4_1e21PNP_phzG_C/PF10590_9/7_9e18Pyrid_ox_like/PF16242_5/3e07Pyridox_oxase_2/PF12766_7/0_00015TetR_C_28/PF17937_1/5_1TetR_C_28/PF17937_1/1_3e02_NODE_2690_length_943_cov_216_994469_g2245_i089730